MSCRMSPLFRSKRGDKWWEILHRPPQLICSFIRYCPPRFSLVPTLKPFRYFKWSHYSRHLLACKLSKSFSAKDKVWRIPTVSRLPVLTHPILPSAFLRKRKRNTAFCRVPLSLSMLVAGLEPARGCPRGILSPLRLPIPPHQLTHCVIFYCMDIRAKHCSIELINANGWRWIRTTEAICSRFTVCPLWPLGNPSMQDIEVLTM